MTTDTSPSSPQPVRPQKQLLMAWLLLLLQGDQAHGYELHRALDAQDVTIDPGVLYRTLRRLEDDGAVASRWMRPIAGPRRRCYQLTSSGRRALDDWAGEIAVTRDLHDTFLRAHRRAIATRDGTG